MSPLSNTRDNAQDSRAHNSAKRTVGSISSSEIVRFSVVVRRSYLGYKMIILVRVLYLYASSYSWNFIGIVLLSIEIL